MIEYIRSWLDRRFSDPRAVALTVVLVIAAVLIWLMVQMLVPVLVSIILAYLLEGMVERLQARNLPRNISVYTVFLVFLTMLVLGTVGLLPLLSQQVSELARELPVMINRFQEWLLSLPNAYPTLFDESQIRTLISSVAGELGQLGQQVVASSFSIIPNLIAILVYLILVPLMVYFFLKDKEAIVRWVLRFLPSDRSLAGEVWTEVDIQLGNYVRGKVIEILIVGTVSYVTFAILDLNYSVLLGVIVGLSVVIPYVGATVVTIPVILIALFQWGWNPGAAIVIVAYLIIQALDGNMLVPLLFSEVVNLHPVAIIIAVLFFGALWGVWGVFFAIPLATVVNAVLHAWPDATVDDSQAAT